MKDCYRNTEKIYSRATTPTLAGKFQSDTEISKVSINQLLIYCGYIKEAVQYFFFEVLGIIFFSAKMF